MQSHFINTTKRGRSLLFATLVVLAIGSICVAFDVRSAVAQGPVAATDSADAVAVPEAATSSFGRNEALIASLTIFSLAVFVGFEIITKVPPTLHTPLMSGSNAISGITLIGATLVAGASNSVFASLLGMLAVALAAINAVGGFVVTDRMLSMFRKKK